MHEVTLLLAVPSINTSLRDELDELDLALPASETGYHPIERAPLPLVVIDLGAVAEREDDDLRRWFAGRPLRTLEGDQWVGQHQSMRNKDSSTMATPDLYGYDEWVRRYVAGLTPAQRLDGLAPEQIAAALKPEQLAETLAARPESEQVLALPDALLRALSDDYVATLPDDVQAKVRARRGH